MHADNELNAYKIYKLLHYFAQYPVRFSSKMNTAQNKVSKMYETRKITFRRLREKKNSIGVLQ